MPRYPALALVLAVFVIAGPASADWPMQRHDGGRSGAGTDPIDAEKLSEVWTWKAPSPPRTAWPMAARWDAYNIVKNLPSLRAWDACYQIAADADRVYLASSVEDAVIALDLKSGKPAWRVNVGGPVRIAPTLHDSRVYFSSDDGAVYCVESATGKDIWHRTLQTDAPWILQNERVISSVPLRTGVVIRDNVAYVGGGLLPWGTGVIAALDAATGEVKYLNKLNGDTLEGPLALSETKIIAPRGHIAPTTFNRADGKQAKDLPGSGGPFCIVTPDGATLRPQAGSRDGAPDKTPNKTSPRGGEVGVYRETGEKLAAIDHGLSLTVIGNTAYVVDGTKVKAVARDTGKVQWEQAAAGVGEIIVSDDTLFLGGEGEVAALNLQGQPQWSKPVSGRAVTLAVSGGCLLVSTDLGFIHCFAKGPTKGKTKPMFMGGPAVGEPPPVPVFTNVTGDPVIRWLRYGEAAIEWESPAGAASVTVTGPQIQNKIFSGSSGAKRIVTLKDLLPNRIYQVTLSGQPPFELDTAQMPPPSVSVPGTTPPVIAAAVKAAGQRGMAVVIGRNYQNEALALAREGFRTTWLVNPGEATALRDILAKLNLCGDGIAVLEAESASDPHLPTAFSTIVFCAAADAKAAHRLARPFGGAVWIPDGKQAEFVRGAPEGAAPWSCQYGSPAGTHFGGEDLRNADGTGGLRTQWLGLPGPRFQSDRGNRQPSPLADRGRLFLQGMQRLMAVDAFSGALLWSTENPGLARYNMPHDCANWCCADGDLFVAQGSRVTRLQGGTGKIQSVFSCPARGLDWGYVARATAGNQELLLGTAVDPAAPFTAYWGADQWYDNASGEHAKTVVGDALFAYDPAKPGKTLWQQKCFVLHPTLCCEGGRITFLALNRTKDASRRIALDASVNASLICLDAATGKMIWEKPVTIPGTPIATYNMMAKDLSVLTFSSGGKFYIEAFRVSDGSSAWKTEVAWESDNHGKHLAHPGTQGELLFIRPAVLDLKTGANTNRKYPGGHTCGSYSLAKNILIGRMGEMVLWDAKDGQESRLTRLRQECWIGTIPGSGMLLAPETGGGCSCGGWLESSVGFIPKATAEEQP